MAVAADETAYRSCDFVCVGVGIVPNVELPREAGLAVDNGVVVNEFLQSTHPDIYAAGDVASYLDPLFGKRRRVEHWGNAEYSGQLIEAVRDTQCAAGREFEIEIALREALANAVVHGCRNDPSKVIECALSCSQAGELIIVVRDPGPGFEPASVPNPVTVKNVHSTHGRGIYLITQLMDEVWFERSGSEIHMVLNGVNTPPTPL